MVFRVLSGKIADDRQTLTHLQPRPYRIKALKDGKMMAMAVSIILLSPLALPPEEYKHGCIRKALHDRLALAFFRRKHRMLIYSIFS